MVLNTILRVLLNPLAEMPVRLFKCHVLVNFIVFVAAVAAVLREEVHIAPEVAAAIGGGKSPAAVNGTEVSKIDTVSFIV